LSDLVRAALFGMALAAILVYVFEGLAVGLVATSSVLIAVVGFALRSIIADVFSGIALNFEHPYRLGDWIEVAPGTVGRVTEIDWRATRLLTRDGITIIVPNGVIAGGRIANYSFPQPNFRVSLRVAVDANVPVERAKRLLLAGALDAARAFPGLRPDVLLQEFGDAGPVYVVRFWVNDYGQENACRDAVAAGVLASLEHAGLAPAYPKQDLVLARERPGRGAAPLARDKLLAQIDVFAPFDADERRQIAAHMAERRFPRGGIVVHQGAPGDSLFVIAEGALDVRVAAAGESERTIDGMVTGEVFGEISLLTGAPRSATVAAATDVVLYEVGKAQLDPILRARPNLADNLATIMAKRQAHNRAQLANAGAATPGATGEAADFRRRLLAFFGLGARL
jgi:CRP-like cAMP-binding protein